MNQTFIDIVFEGDKFSPNKLKELTGLDIETLSEYGEIAEKGRYKGKKSPYGLGILKIVSTSFEDINSVLTNVVQTLLKKKNALKQSAVDEITLDLENFSENDVEISIDKEIIKKISELNANIEISSIIDSGDKYLDSNKRIYSNRYREIEKDLFMEFYSDIISETTIFNNLSTHQAEKLKSLFQEKFRNEEMDQLKIPQAILMSAIFFYIIKYIEEDDFDKIPPFEKVLKEHYSL